MTNSEIKITVNAWTNEYTRLFTGLQTDQGAMRFKKAFSRYLDSYSDGFGSVGFAIKSFIADYKAKKAKAA